MCEGDTSRKWALVAEKTTTLAALNPAIILLGVCLKDHVWQLGRKKCTMMVLLVADGGEKVESTLRLNPGVLLVGMEDEAATVKNSMTFLKKKKKRELPFCYCCSVVFNSLRSCGLQRTRLPCPSPSLRACSNKLMSVESVMPSNHLILCCPLLLLPSSFPSIRVFSNESTLYMRWPKYWSFSFSISPSNEYLGLISLRIDCYDLLAVKGTLKSLLQHHSSKASILQHSAFFIVQFTSIHDYWKNRSLD